MHQCIGLPFISTVSAMSSALWPGNIFVWKNSNLSNKNYMFNFNVYTVHSFTISLSQKPCLLFWYPVKSSHYLYVSPKYKPPDMTPMKVNQKGGIRLLKSCAVTRWYIKCFFSQQLIYSILYYSLYHVMLCCSKS